jgi:hypothetical protein
MFKTVKYLRSRIRTALKNGFKSGSAVRDLGCSIEEFKLHLESQFADGMTWDNQGQWHIDHIIPLCKFNLSNREEFLQACHYTNMRPLWAKDNLTRPKSTFLAPSSSDTGSKLGKIGEGCDANTELSCMDNTYNQCNAYQMNPEQGI